MAHELELINPKTIGTELQKYKSQMEAALPRHMTADRMARIALTSLRMNPKLMNTTRESFYGSLMAASQLGLEPGVNGQCYLIPYGNICTLVPGWRGYMDLLNRTKSASARTEVVYKGDDFDYEMGTESKIHHKRGSSPGGEEDITHVYAVGKIKGIEDFPVFDVWSIEKVKAHRDKQNKVGTRHYSYTHLEMYARKVVLLQVLKYLPSSIELANASALDVTGTEGRQALTIDMALKGEFENGAGVDVPSADDPLQKEIDTLFEQAQTNPASQKLLRESYSTRPQELIEYLKGKQAPVVITTKTEPRPAVVQQAQLTPSAYQEPEQKRGRGRPSKEEVARRQATEQPSPVPDTETIKQPMISTLIPDPSDYDEPQEYQEAAQEETSAFDLSATVLANKSRKKVHFEFNGTDVIVEPDESKDEVQARWQKHFDDAAKEYREHPDRIKEANERELKDKLDRKAHMVCMEKNESDMRDAQVPWPKTKKQLAEYIDSLTSRTDHDYGTCVYAMSMAAQAAFNYVAGQLGVTGFQLSCADMDFIKRTRGYKGPFMIINGENALYPDLHGRLMEAMEEWKPWLKEQAQMKLRDARQANPNVIAHWKMLADMEVEEVLI
ncbi:unnamed protein product [Sphagnum jensenii]